MTGLVAALLTVYLPKGAQVEAKVWPIYAGDEFDFGRQDICSVLNYEDRSISKHHFRIRCILFDEDDPTIAPMVYLHVLSANGLIICNSSERQQLVHSDGPRLLNSGDVIRLPKVSVHFTAISQEKGRSEEALTDGTVLRCRSDTYRLTDHIIGCGAYARVLVAIRDSDSSQLACKVLAQAQTARKQLLWREVQVLKNIDHPNVIRLEKVILTTSNTYILQELGTGGDLLSYQNSRGLLAEPEVICIAYQLVQAVHYLHTNNIAHRDIKPENILLTSWKPGTRIMLADFGQARSMTSPEKRSTRMASIAGTLGWQAPELRCAGNVTTPATLNYGQAVDMWSLGGVILACFTGNRPSDILEYSTAGDPLHTSEGRDAQTSQIDHLLQQCGTRTSKDAKSFIHDCLCIDECSRITASQAIQHPWFARREYSRELVLAYERAVKGWTSRMPFEDLIESCHAVHTQEVEVLQTNGSPMVIGANMLAVGTSLPDFVPPPSTQLPQPEISQYLL